MVESTTDTTPVIMIVEDEALVRVVAAEYFLERGLVVIEAENAEMALAELNRRSDVRLLFTDINMPGRMDGLALAREVHRRWPTILLMLTSGRSGVPATAIPDGGQFVMKPYDFEELADKIHNMLRR
jgi:two-component system, response regulator PdtaR